MQQKEVGLFGLVNNTTMNAIKTVDHLGKSVGNITKALDETTALLSVAIAPIAVEMQADLLEAKVKAVKQQLKANAELVALGLTEEEAAALLTA
jgi:hypothetical protein